MNLKAFLTDALGQALELGIGTPDDVLRHVTPDVLATHLPRPLWARLFTACLGAARVDAQLVVETIGVPNLCEHVPSYLIWACISEIAARSLGQTYTAPTIMTRASLTPSSLGIIAEHPDRRAAARRDRGRASRDEWHASQPAARRPDHRARSR